MARIRSFYHFTPDVRPHRSDVDCGYTVLQSETGPLLHLATFGSDQRKFTGAASQLLQIDRERASELLRIIGEAFPGLVAAEHSAD